MRGSPEWLPALAGPIRIRSPLAPLARRSGIPANDSNKSQPRNQRAQQYDPRVSENGRGQAPDQEATVFVERRWQSNIVLALILVAFAVALFNAVRHAQTSAGRVTGAVVFGAVLVLLIAGWIRMNRRPRRRLEITADAIRYVEPGGRVSALSRQPGDELAFSLQHRGAMSRVWVLELAVNGTGTVINVRGEFPRAAVRQACIARGWHFDKQRRNWRGQYRNDKG